MLEANARVCGHVLKSRRSRRCQRYTQQFGSGSGSESSQQKRPAIDLGDQAIAVLREQEEAFRELGRYIFWQEQHRPTASTPGLAGCKFADR